MAPLDKTDNYYVKTNTCSYESRAAKIRLHRGTSSGDVDCGDVQRSKNIASRRVSRLQKSSTQNKKSPGQLSWSGLYELAS